MLLVHDPAIAETELVAGTIGCPDDACAGQLGPWGHARLRRIRVTADRTLACRPRRARCRRCRRTHVLWDLRTYPRRVDTAETVLAALLAAAEGLGHRRVADQIDRPVSTVRNWLRRARLNAELVRCDATFAYLRFEAMPARIRPTGTILGDALEALGVAVAAWVRRHGPTAPPVRLAGILTGAALLSAHPRTVWWGCM